MEQYLKSDDKITGEEDLRSPFTQNAVEKIPSWTKANKDKKSIFQQLINHGIMHEVNSGYQNLIRSEFNSFFDLADEDLPYIAFKIKDEDIAPYAYKVFIDTTVCAEVPGDSAGHETLRNCKTIRLESKLEDDIDNNDAETLNIDAEHSHFEYKGKEIDITTSMYKYGNSYMPENDKGHESKDGYYFYTNERVYYNPGTGYIYFQQPYDYENLRLINRKENRIYSVNKQLRPHHIWNSFDEESLYHNLLRLPQEQNTSYKARLKHKAEHPSNSTYTGLKNHIERELGIGDTTNEPYLLSEELGINKEEVSLYKLKDDEYTNSLSREELKDIAKQVNYYIRLLWGETEWDRDYWDTVHNQEFKHVPDKVDI